jgi:hypothetical protein
MAYAPIAAGPMMAALIVQPGFAAAEDVPTEPVQLKKGTWSATLHGVIAGGQGVDCLFGAKAGQAMTFRLRADDVSNCSNALPPGSAAAIARNG